MNWKKKSFNDLLFTIQTPSLTSPASQEANLILILISMAAITNVTSHIIFLFFNIAVVVGTNYQLNILPIQYFTVYICWFRLVQIKSDWHHLLQDKDGADYFLHCERKELANLKRDLEETLGVTMNQLQVNEPQCAHFSTGSPQHSLHCFYLALRPWVRAASSCWTVPERGRWCWSCYLRSDTLVDHVGIFSAVKWRRPATTHQVCCWADLVCIRSIRSSSGQMQIYTN